MGPWTAAAPCASVLPPSGSAPRRWPTPTTRCACSRACRARSATTPSSRSACAPRTRRMPRCGPRTTGAPSCAPTSSGPRGTSSSPRTCAGSWAPPPRVIRAMAYRHAQVGLDDPAHVARSLDTLTELLRGRTFLTRREIGQAFAERGGLPSAGEQLGHLLLLAELEGAGLLRPAEGGAHLPSARQVVPRLRPLAHDDALARLAHRFFAGRGPATPEGPRAVGERDLRPTRGPGSQRPSPRPPGRSRRWRSTVSRTSSTPRCRGAPQPPRGVPAAGL